MARLVAAVLTPEPPLLQNTRDHAARRAAAAGLLGGGPRRRARPPHAGRRDPAAGAGLPARRRAAHGSSVSGSNTSVAEEDRAVRVVHLELGRGVERVLDRVRNVEDQDVGPHLAGQRQAARACRCARPRSGRRSGPPGPGVAVRARSRRDGPGPPSAWSSRSPLGLLNESNGESGAVAESRRCPVPRRRRTRHPPARSDRPRRPRLQEEGRDTDDAHVRAPVAERLDHRHVDHPAAVAPVGAVTDVGCPVGVTVPARLEASPHLAGASGRAWSGRGRQPSCSIRSHSRSGIPASRRRSRPGHGTLPHSGKLSAW